MKHGLTPMSSSEQENAILSPGTVGLEMEAHAEEGFCVELDCILAPCGGGDLLSGITIAMKGQGTSVFGAEPQMGRIIV